MPWAQAHGPALAGAPGGERTVANTTCLIERPWIHAIEGSTSCGSIEFILLGNPLLAARATAAWAPLAPACAHGTEDAAPTGAKDR